MPSPLALPTFFEMSPAREMVISAESGGIGLSIVIPTYNEAENIEQLILSLDALLRHECGGDFELIVVDDDSPDGTWQRARALCSEVSALRVLRRTKERGLSTAVIRGWQMSRGDVLGVMDADFQHPPRVNLQLLGEMKKGAELAVASRNVPDGGVSAWSLSRRVLSRGAQLIGLLCLPEVFGRLSDPMSGYFMVRRASIAGVPLMPLGYKILVEVMTRGRVRWVAEVPYVFQERVVGGSKVTWRLSVEYLHHLARLRLFTLSRTPFFRYSLVGFAGFCLEMGLLYLLSDSDSLGWGVARSKILSAQPVFLWNFVLHEVWSFSRLNLPRESEQVLRRFLAYYAVATVGLFFALGILSALVEFAHSDQYLANGIGVFIVAGWNYWLHCKITWAAA